MLFSLIGGGCGKRADRVSSAAPPPNATAAAGPTFQSRAEIAATPPPATGAAGPTFVSTSIQATCDTSGGQPQIRVSFAATAQGGNLTRVRLLDNGAVADDSGPLDQAGFGRIVTFRAPYGERHTYQVVTDSPGGTFSAANVSSSIECSPPPVSPGPRL